MIFDQAKNQFFHPCFFSILSLDLSGFPTGKNTCLTHFLASEIKATITISIYFSLDMVGLELISFSRLLDGDNSHNSLNLPHRREINK